MLFEPFMQCQWHTGTRPHSAFSTRPFADIMWCCTHVFELYALSAWMRGRTSCGSVVNEGYWIELNTFMFSNIRVHRAIIIHTCLNNHWAITRIKTRIPEKSLAYLAGFPIDILNGQCEIIDFTLDEVENMMCDICADWLILTYGAF